MIPHRAVLLQLLLVAACTGDVPAESGEGTRPGAAPPPGRVQVADPVLPFVVAGVDTFTVRRPTLVAYFGIDMGEGARSQARTAIVEGFQQVLSEVQVSFQGLGVGLALVDERPSVGGVAPEALRDAGPTLRQGGVGFLLVDRQGHVRRFDGLVEAPALLCRAAELFELSLQPADEQRCAGAALPR